MAAKILSRLIAPLLMLTAACQVSTGDEPGTSESFSTDSAEVPTTEAPNAEAPDAETPSTDHDPFAWQCEGIADEVAYCETELPLWEPDADVATACAPEDAATALACCNAFGGDYCAAACEAGDVSGAGDLAELEDYLGDGGLASATSRVAATCGGATVEDLLQEEASASSALLASYGLDSWGEATPRPVDAIGGLFLMGFDEVERMLDELGRDGASLAWSFDRQVGTEEGEYFLTKWVFYYPSTGVVIVLEGAVGFV